MRALLLGSLLVMTFSRCANRLDKTDYINYLTTHEKEFRIETGSTVKYQLRYTPVEEIVARNMDNFSKEESKSELKKMKTSSSSLFELKIVVPSGTLFTQNKSPKAEQMEYYSVHFKNNLKAVTNGSDTLDVNNCIFQANGGFGSTSYFEVEFPGKLEEIREMLIYPKYLGDSIVVIDLSPLKHEYPELRIK